MIDRDEYYDCHESKEELLQGADDSYCEEECDDDEEARGYQMKLYAKCPYCGNQTEQLGVSFDAWNELVAQDTEKAELIEKLEARIEELISAKGIRELEARLADAEREACAKIADGDKQCEKANCTEQHYCREAIAAAIRKRGEL